MVWPSFKNGKAETWFQRRFNQDNIYRSDWYVQVTCSTSLRASCVLVGCTYLSFLYSRMPRIGTIILTSQTLQSVLSTWRWQVSEGRTWSSSSEQDAAKSLSYPVLAFPKHVTLRSRTSSRHLGSFRNQSRNLSGPTQWWGKSWDHHQNSKPKDCMKALLLRNSPVFHISLGSAFVALAPKLSLLVKS